VRDGRDWTFSRVPLSTTEAEDLTAEPGLAERFQLVRRIADDLAHELKNPLNAMVINLEVLRAKVRNGNADAALERIEVLEQETRRLHHLLDIVMRLLRPDPPGPTGFPVDAVLAEVGTIAAVLGKVSRRGFELQPAGDDALVQGRREPLRFALLVLAEAALAGTPAEDGGVLLTAVAGPSEVELTLTAPAAAAARLQAALPTVASLLAGEDSPLGASLDETGCRVRIALARAGV
jgi:signal transduction histidine kinase